MSASPFSKTIIDQDAFGSGWRQSDIIVTPLDRVRFFEAEMKLSRCLPVTGPLIE
jgi:hypothetical protein